jgi:hypothetical protein
MAMQDYWEKAKKFRPMDVLERAQGLDGMLTGDDVIAKYDEQGIDYGKDSDIYKLGQDMMKRDSAYNQSIRAGMESSSADAQAETMRQNQRMIAMGGGNMPTAAINAQNLQSANQAQANTAQQFEQGQMAREQKGIGVLTGAMNNQSQLLNQAMTADQARNTAKTNAYTQGLGMLSNIYGGINEQAGKALRGGALGPAGMAVGQFLQKGGYMEGYQKGGKVDFKPHMMYKGNSEAMAKTYKEHLALKEQGYSPYKGMMYGGSVKKMQTGDFVKSDDGEGKGLLSMLKNTGLYRKGVLGVAGDSFDDGMIDKGIRGAGDLYRAGKDKISLPEGFGDKVKGFGKGLLKYGALGGLGFMKGMEALTREASMPGSFQFSSQLENIGGEGGEDEGVASLQGVAQDLFKKEQLNKQKPELIGPPRPPEMQGMQEGGYQDSILNRIPMRVGGGKIG